MPDDLRSFVLIGAPHTSNFDMVPAMVVASRLRRNSRFMIKSDWLKFPFGLFLKPAGAYGIDRKKMAESGHLNQVEYLAGLFQQIPDFVLMIAPEGTRSANDTWKTGFYYIAKASNVPIVLGYADYTKKVAGLGKMIYPTEFEKDMKDITAFYSTVAGRHPERFLLDKNFS